MRPDWSTRWSVLLAVCVLVLGGAVVGVALPTRDSGTSFGTRVSSSGVRPHGVIVVNTPQVTSAQAGTWTVGATQGGDWLVGAQQSGDWTVDLGDVPTLTVQVANAQPMPVEVRSAAVRQLSCVTSWNASAGVETSIAALVTGEQWTVITGAPVRITQGVTGFSYAYLEVRDMVTSAVVGNLPLVAHHSSNFPYPIALQADFRVPPHSLITLRALNSSYPTVGSVTITGYELD